MIIMDRGRKVADGTVDELARARRAGARRDRTSSRSSCASPGTTSRSGQTVMDAGREPVHHRAAARRTGARAAAAAARAAVSDRRDRRRRLSVLQRLCADGHARRASAPAARGAPSAGDRSTRFAAGGARARRSRAAGRRPRSAGCCRSTAACSTSRRPRSQFLFPAPVSRRSLLVHRMLRSQIGMLFGSIILGLMVAVVLRLRAIARHPSRPG